MKNGISVLEAFSIVFMMGFLGVSVLMFIDLKMGTSFMPDSPFEAVMYSLFFLLMSRMFHWRTETLHGKEKVNAE